MLLKLVSVKSVAIGVVLAVIALAFLWPLNGLGASVALMAFAVGAGVSELVFRLLKPSAPAASDKPAASEK